jgi:antitoxin CptB
VSTPSAVQDLQIRRLRWRCRRGLKELDVLLERFVRTRLPGASPPERAAFEELLALPDPDLAGYLLGEEVPRQPAMAQLVASIRTYVD